MLRYTTDRARPGLVALYDIRPGNGAGQFLQPQSPHGADGGKNTHSYTITENTRKMYITDCIRNSKHTSTWHVIMWPLSDITTVCLSLYLH